MMLWNFEQPLVVAPPVSRQNIFGNVSDRRCRKRIEPLPTTSDSFLIIENFDQLTNSYSNLMGEQRFFSENLIFLFVASEWPRALILSIKSKF